MIAMGFGVVCPIQLATAAESRADVGGGFAPQDIGEVYGESFFYVDVFQQLEAFARVRMQLYQLSKTLQSSAFVPGTDAYVAYGKLVTSIHPMLSSIRAPGPVLDITGKDQQYGYYYNDNPSRRLTLRELKQRSNGIFCAYFPTAFATTVMDQNGNDWLFSDSIEDEDLGALDRAIARAFDAAYHSTRVYCMVHHAQLLPLFDPVYENCVGDMLDAFRRLQAS